MRLRSRAANETPEVPLTPLIDCVFLLIVFFLVTSMFKRWEMLIPVRLPDVTSSLSATAAETVALIGIDREGNFSLGERITVENEPIVRYVPANSLGQVLQLVKDSMGPEGELVIAAHRDVPMQSLIQAVDEIKLMGFMNVSIQTSERRP